MGTPRDKGIKLGGRAAVIALAPAIREALAAGHYLTAIHARYAEQLGISYPQFCKHVQKYVTGGDQGYGKAKRPPAEAAAGQKLPDRHVLGEGASAPGAQKTAASGPRTMGPGKLPEFHYDPMDAYRHRIRKQKE
jgi:hypothetical protein